LKVKNGLRDLGWVSPNVIAKERVVRAASQKLHQGSVQLGPDLGGGSLPRAEQAGAARHHQKQQKQKYDANAE
jgi:hypothetical protein